MSRVAGWLGGCPSAGVQYCREEPTQPLVLCRHAVLRLAAACARCRSKQTLGTCPSSEAHFPSSLPPPCSVVAATQPPPTRVPPVPPMAHPTARPWQPTGRRRLGCLSCWQVTTACSGLARRAGSWQEKPLRHTQAQQVVASSLPTQLGVCRMVAQRPSPLPPRRRCCT